MTKNTFRKSVIDIVHDVSLDGLRWPTTSESATWDEGGSFGGNHHFVDLSDITWSEALNYLTEETELLKRIQYAEDPDEELENIEDEAYEDPGRLPVDLGTASCVAALSAAGCFPFSSCNGGLLDTNHHEQYPLIALCAKPKHIPLLISCAVNSNCGLEKEESGFVVLYAQTIFDLMTFAETVIKRKAEFNKLEQIHP